nr:40S ribosomal protein SA-like [Physcomitrium patens]|eukprot:XP_024395515.1 40S ribosomal protein SA-like [Physcomitrella patens]
MGDRLDGVGGRMGIGRNGERGWVIVGGEGRGLIVRVGGGVGCAVQVDLFFYREPDEGKDREEEEGGAAEFAAVEYAAPTLALGGDAQWGPEAAEAGQWETDAAAGAVPAGAPAGWDVGAAAAPVAPAGWDPAAPAEAPVAPAGWEPAA